MPKRNAPLWLAFIALMCLTIHASAAGPYDAELLVANPKMRHPLWGRTILLVKPLANGGHFGFILNKPTRATLGQLFPEHEPSKKVTDPLFLGGPWDRQRVFALVERHDGKSGDTIQITEDLFLAVRADAVDKIIESESDHARFFIGMVAWVPGELKAELDRGLWYETDADAKVVLQKKTEGQWEELVRSLQIRDRSI